MKTETFQRALALLLIGVMAGPELGLAMEMTVLLEILGAAAFFMAFSVGARMLIQEIVQSLRDYLYPPFIGLLKLPMAIAYSVYRIACVVAAMLVAALYLHELARGTLV